MPPKKTSVLVVDDDIRILRMLQRMLELEGYRVIPADSAETALDVFNDETPSLVVLDIMMPGMDGITACRRIREFSKVPIIMVTAKDTNEDKVEGLDAGADDYMTKPLSAEELVARVRAVLRRARFPDEPSQPTFCSGDLVIDFARHQVSVNGEDVHLSPTEYKILSYLVGNADKVVTPDQLLEKVWGKEYIGATHTLQVNIARLRQKLNDHAEEPKYIMTRPGIGYMISKPA
jgi:DNA-binding response OmpR family regulator